MDRTEEEALIRAAQAKPERFAPLYEHHFTAIFRFILKRAADRDLTADLTQQTFLKAMVALPRYEPRGLPFKAFLYRIALNELHMYWRKRKEKVMDLSHAEVKGLSEELGMPEQEAELASLGRALGRLSADKAQLIELRYMDGMSFAEMGAVLGVGEDAAKMRTHRVLSTLRTYLSPRA
ncbi:MAG: RNA polymerase sigma factor [Flavobacteriales bacterium]|jgi:RNA polymerase sigma-70 factor (ECF subfamily)|nr:RNA polymerase sigma factor [Flavobacteriales bacterium]MBK9512893.1 RNA polymerase sigma factor [Flavobacteriales bacterium]MBP7449280.1 RNA polymerase sigma factor [Flavobacteriales bacterium]HOZ41264.1 RNA polymerase sigma factor [Flavobacteriales bacterium]